MTFFKVILIGVVFGLVGGLLRMYFDPWSIDEKKQPTKKKNKKKKSPWDKDPFFGSPLQKF